MSINRKNEAENSKSETTIESPTIHTSTETKYNVKQKQFFIDINYPPLEFNHYETFLTTLLAPASTLHLDPTITNLFSSITSMYQLTVKKIKA